jgi:hypothetical protein
MQPQSVKDVGEAVGVDVGVCVIDVGVLDGVLVNVGGTKIVFVTVGVKVLVGVLVGVTEAVCDEVGVYVDGRKGVSEDVGVLVIVLVGETVPVKMLGVWLPVAVRILRVPVSDGMAKSVLVAVAVGAFGSGLRKYANNPKQ